MKVSLFYLTETLTVLLLLVSIYVTAFDNNSHIISTFAQGQPLDEAEKLLSDLQRLMNQSGGMTQLIFPVPQILQLITVISVWQLITVISVWQLITVISVWKVREEKILVDNIVI